MRTVQRIERVRYDATQMFDLVNDIESYPEFLNWCQASCIERSNEQEVLATLDVGLGGVRKRFTTRNALDRPRQMEIELVDGPLRSLRGTWRFENQAEAGCIVELRLEFEVAHTPMDMMFGMLFEEIMRSQIAAFIQRAESLYG